MGAKTLLEQKELFEECLKWSTAVALMGIIPAIWGAVIPKDEWYEDMNPTLWVAVIIGVVEFLIFYGYVWFVTSRYF